MPGFDSPVRAHRAAWMLYRGKIPKGKFVLHRCDNPPCVNPDHLFLGSHQSNHDDMVSKKRGVWQTDKNWGEQLRKYGFYLPDGRPAVRIRCRVCKTSFLSAVHPKKRRGKDLCSRRCRTIFRYGSVEAWKNRVARSARQRNRKEKQQRRKSKQESLAEIRVLSRELKAAMLAAL